MSGPRLLSAGRALNASIVPSDEYAAVSPTMTTSLIIASAVAVGSGEPAASPLASTLAGGAGVSAGRLGVSTGGVGSGEVVAGDSEPAGGLEVSDGDAPGADSDTDGSGVPRGPVGRAVWTDSDGEANAWDGPAVATGEAGGASVAAAVIAGEGDAAASVARAV